MKVRLVLLASVGVLVAGVLIGNAIGERRRTVLFDNANDFDVAVTLDGKPIGTVRAHQHQTQSIEAGAHTLFANGGAAGSEQDAFTVVPNAKGGFRGVYNLGGRGRYALVTATYGGPSSTPPIEPVGVGVRFFEMPASVELISEIDDSFPSTMPGHGVTQVAHLCHVADDGTVPCVRRP